MYRNLYKPLRIVIRNNIAAHIFTLIYKFFSLFISFSIGYRDNFTSTVNALKRFALTSIIMTLFLDINLCLITKIYKYRSSFFKRILNSISCQSSSIFRKSIIIYVFAPSRQTRLVHKNTMIYIQDSPFPLAYPWYIFLYSNYSGGASSSVSGSSMFLSIGLGLTVNRTRFLKIVKSS